MTGGDVIHLAIVAIGGWYFVGKPLYSSLRTSGSSEPFAAVVSLGAIAALAGLFSFRDHLSHALYSPTGEWK